MWNEAETPCYVEWLATLPWEYAAADSEVKQQTEQKPQTNGRLYTTVAAGGEQKLTWHGLINILPRLEGRWCS
jgi:hypothetical protein